MRRPGRILWRLAAGFAALGAGLLLVSVETVDYRPYLGEDYFRETAARVKADAGRNTVARGELAAGFGRALLSPRLHSSQDDPASGQFRAVPLAGYGDRHGRPAEGVHDDLYVKAVALRVGNELGVVVSADALIIPREVTQAAMKRLDSELLLSREHVYLGATHTHSGLGAWAEGVVGEAFAGPFQKGVRAWFADRIVAAAREAVEDLKPASFGHGQFNARAFVRNRLVGELGQVDPEFSYAVLRQESGKTAVWGAFAAHATVLSSDTVQFSADFPGCWQREVEKALGGTALYLAGGVGSQAPVAGERGFQGTERMGHSLAQMLLENLPATPLTNWVALGMRGLEVTLPPLNVRVSDGLRLRPWIARRLLRAQETTFVQGLRINDTLWLSTPCDFSGELALETKHFFWAQGTTAVVTSFNGDYIGYVIPSRYYHMNGYEPRLMSFFGPNVPDYLERWIRAVGASLTSQ